MCYRCAQCGSVEPHNTPMRKYTAYRKAKDSPHRTEIEGEWPVCAECYKRLTGVLHPMDVHNLNMINNVYGQQVKKPVFKSKRNNKKVKNAEG
jgi:hypothetical protein